MFCPLLDRYVPLWILRYCTIHIYFSLFSGLQHFILWQTTTAVFYSRPKEVYSLVDLNTSILQCIVILCEYFQTEGKIQDCSSADSVTVGLARVGTPRGLQFGFPYSPSNTTNWSVQGILIKEWSMEYRPVQFTSFKAREKNHKFAFVHPLWRG